MKEETTSDESKNKTELNDEQLEKVSGGAVSVHDGKCGILVNLQNNKCTKMVFVVGGTTNPCVGCKYY